MNKLVIAAALSLSATLLAGTPAHAGPQQERMKSCNKEAGAKQLTGDERKAFMKSCLSTGKSEEAAAAPSAKATPQEKMKSCNKDAAAKKLSGDERKKFMSECLGG